MKKLVLPVLLSLVLIFNFVSNSFAATVGEVLSSPEQGWTRIDDNDKNIQYIGSGWSTLERDAYYKSSRHNSLSSSLDDYIKIVFKGTKIRLITSAFPGYTDNLKVTIDGIGERYSQTAPTDSNIVLTYEKTGLSDRIHTVIISKVTKGSYSFDLTLDAIDIDGTLLPPDTTVPDPSPTSEPTPSPTPESTATPLPEPTSTPTPTPSSADRAILTITMTTGLDKEFDLSMGEVNSFIAWYETKEAGTGTASYAIDKHDNNKGPFSSRKDYVIFKNILSFEVDEYSTKTTE
jgi:hypothetical protein